MFGCTAARRSVKFVPGPHAHHFLVFDTSICKEDRIDLLMQLFTFSGDLSLTDGGTDGRGGRMVDAAAAADRPLPLSLRDPATSHMDDNDEGYNDSKSEICSDALVAGDNCFVDTARNPYFAQSRYTPHDLVEARVCADPMHPACGQLGLYARKTIPANTIVTPYTGLVEICSVVSCGCYSSRTYTMGYGSLGDDYAIDAEFAGNFGRFANDPRGVEGRTANLVAESRYNSKGEAYTALVSRRLINEGEEILMSYGRQHNLTAGAWMDYNGEQVTRQRMGGLVPFPDIREEVKHDGEGEMSHSTAHNSEDNSATPVWKRRVHLQIPSSSTMLRPTGSKSPLLATNAPETKRTTRISSDRRMHLLWECPQCGMWSPGSPTLSQIDLCVRCHAPRLSRSRLVAMLDVSPPTDPHAFTSCSWSPSTLSTANNTVSVTWPMNIPFLSWQLWDPSIPLPVIARYSKFDPQDSLLLYNTTTTVEFHDTAEPNGNATELRNGKRNRDSDWMSTETRTNGMNSEEDDYDVVDEQPRRQKKIVLSSRMAKRNMDGTQNDNDRSSGDGNAVDLESPRVNSHCVRANDVVFLTATKTEAKNRVADGIRAFKTRILLSHSDDAGGEQQRAKAHTVESITNAAIESAAATTASPTSTSGGDGGFGLLAREPERLLQWSPKDSRHASNNVRGGNTDGTHEDKEVPRQMGGARFHTFVARFHALFSSGIPVKRVFSSVDVQKGDLVGYAGGVIRRRSDPHVRFDESPLEIPLHYFITERARRCIQRLIHKQQKQSQKQQRNSGDDTLSAGEAWQAQLVLLYRTLSELSLVVTDEMMFCPTVTVDVDGEEDINAPPELRTTSTTSTTVDCGGSNILDDVLNTCNVTFVLTFDSLGSPHIAVVALRSIKAFEPLMARVGM